MMTAKQDKRDATPSPSDQDTLMTFCLGSDEAYFPGLLMATLSTIYSLSPTKRYHFIILDGGIEEASYAKLAELVDQAIEDGSHRLTYERIAMDMSTFDDLPKIWDRSAMTYARILIPDLTDVDSAIWVDADMLIFQDLSEFTATDLDNTLIAGVIDPVIKHLDGDCPLEPQERDNDDTTYVNCGLLWMNLKRMREEDFKTRIFAFMAEHKAKLTYWDQTALNACTIGSKETLPKRYNTFCLMISNEDLATEITDHHNLHMVSPDKPWITDGSLENVTRDLTFWKLWDLLTGADSSAEINKITGRITTKDYYKSILKRHFYNLTGSDYRKKKWHAAWQEKHYIRGGVLERQLDGALASWKRAAPARP